MPVAPSLRPFAPGSPRRGATLRAARSDGGSDALIDSALDLVDTTRPLLGVGGGVLLQAGAASIDIGYRYKQILTGDTLAATLNEGKNFHVNQVRVGVGVRF